MSEPSVTRKADREQMSAAVAELAREHGLAVKRETGGPGSRLAQVRIEGPYGLKLKIEFDGDSRVPDVYVLSWHGVEDGVRLNPMTFASVNRYHGQKATEVARGYRALVTVLRQRFADIESKRAFIIGAYRSSTGS